MEYDILSTLSLLSSPNHETSIPGCQKSTGIFDIGDLYVTGKTSFW